jgi:predicted amidophosphoribosyltransferase
MTVSATEPEADFRPADGTEEGTVFVCGLCGARFTHGGQVCGGCALQAGCHLVKCPSCGYQFPRSSRLVDWLRRRWGGGAK